MLVDPDGRDIKYIDWTATDVVSSIRKHTDDPCSCGICKIQAQLDASNTRFQNSTLGGPWPNQIGASVKFEWERFECCCDVVGWKQWKSMVNYLGGFDVTPDTEDPDAWYNSMDSTGLPIDSPTLVDSPGYYGLGSITKEADAYFRSQLVCREGVSRGQVLYTIDWAVSIRRGGGSYGGSYGYRVILDLHGYCGDAKSKQIEFQPKFNVGW